ncbi:MAG: hypothetical protein LBM60_09365 [Clostridium sp.]|jgi:hypothetical protein|nr:hypothetical protein [Clostridium sp.]
MERPTTTGPMNQLHDDAYERKQNANREITELDNPLERMERTRHSKRTKPVWQKKPASRISKQGGFIVAGVLLSLSVGLCVFVWQMSHSNLDEYDAPSDIREALHATTNTTEDLGTSQAADTNQNTTQNNATVDQQNVSTNNTISDLPNTTQDNLTTGSQDSNQDNTTPDQANTSQGNTTTGQPNAAAANAASAQENGFGVQGFTPSDSVPVPGDAIPVQGDNIYNLANLETVTTSTGRVVDFAPCDESVSAKMVVNLRSEPSTLGGEESVVTQLENGQIAKRTGISPQMGWSRLEYEGQILYAVSSLLWRPDIDETNIADETP